MPYQHFAVPASGGEIQEQLNRFLASHQVLRVDKQFVANGVDSFWAYQVHWVAGNDASRVTEGGRKGMVDYKEILNETDFELFLKLKEWRKEKAKAEGVEPYAVFTNAQLAEAVTRRCETAASLKEIAGVGEGRVEKYGQSLLELLKNSHSSEG